MTETMLAAILVDPWVTGPAAVIVTVVILWYWNQLDAAGIPTSRRRIRRGSLALALCSLPLLFYGLSWVDSAVDPDDFVLTWLLLMLAVLLFFLTAVADLANSYLLARARRQRMMLATRAKLGEALAASDDET